MSTKVSLFGSTSISPVGSSSSGGSGFGGSLLGGSSGSSLFGGYGYGTGLLGSTSGFGYGSSLPSSGGGSSGGGSSTPSAPQVGPQGVDISKQVDEDSGLGLDFVGSDFKVSDATALDSLKIVTKPSNGTLTLDGVEVSVDQIIDVDDFGKLNYVPDADFDGVETFTIAMSTDGSDYDSTPSNVSITVLASDDAPSIDLVSTIPVAEGATASNVGALLVASFNDPDTGDSLGSVEISNIPTANVGTLSYTSDAGGTVEITVAATPTVLSASEAATLQFAAAEDSVAPGTSPASTTFDYTVEDSTGLASAGPGTITLQITDGNDAPTFTAGTTDSYSIDENLTDIAANVNPATDEETPDTLTYSITGTDAALFNVDTANGDLSFKAAADYEDAQDSNKDNVYRFNLIATDDGGKTAKQAIEVEVDDVAAALTMAATSPTVNEGVTGVIVTPTLTNDDSSNDVTFTFNGGDDDDLFNIDEDTGAISFKSVPDFENPDDGGAAPSDNAYEVDILVTDSEGTTAATSITISVANINDEDPAFSSASTTAPFTSANTTEGSLSVDVAEDSTNAPVFAVAFDNGEGAPAPATPSLVTYSLSTNAGTSNFDISTAGVISLTASAELDFESRDTIQLTVTATDGEGDTAKTTVQVNVTDVDENPVYTAPANPVSVDSDEDVDIGDEIEDAFVDPEGTAMTFTVVAPTAGTPALTGATTAGVLQYNLNGVNNAAVTIPAGSSATALTINEVASLVYFGPDTTEAHAGSVTDATSASFVATIAITASDTAGNSATAAFEITVVDIDA